MSRDRTEPTERAREALLDAQANEGRVWPSYGRFGVANIPDTVAWLLGVDAERPLDHGPVGRLADGPIEHVVLFVVDGLGYDRFQELRSSLPRLDRLASTAEVCPLTSTYPSETAAAMTTLFTGLQPVEHGLLGWFTRFEEPTVIGHALPFRSLDGDPLDEAYGHHPTQILDSDHRRMLPRTLTDAGVAVSYVLPEAVAASHASQLTAGPATRQPYEDLTAAFDRIAAAVSAADGPTYHLVYDPSVDAQGHHHGTQSPAFEDAVVAAMDALYDGFLSRLDSHCAAETAVLLAADHGQVDTDPATNVDLAELEAAEGIELTSRLETGPSGEPLYLAGGPRNLQLHLEPGRSEPVSRAFKETIPSLVLDRTAIEATALFGDRPPSATYAAREPTLIVVPDRGSVWYDDGELDHIGMHGGMDPEEMLVPFAAATASELIREGTREGGGL